MRVLVLGGTHHVGRAVVETALARGDDVTTLNRGVSGHQPPGALALQGLACRPIERTVADTWRWLQEEGYPPPGRLEHGLSPDKERRLLDGMPR
jgi:uncharacterized protein YbjT (DUF2867 family)